MRSEPRWPATVAVLAVGGIYLAIPEYLSLGPRWLLLSVMILLAIPALLTHRAGLTKIASWLGIAISLILTGDLIWSVALLVSALPKHKISPQDLLRSAAAIWTTNVLVFALWYWRLDSGGHRAESQQPHCGSAFLFPQMMMQGQSGGGFTSPDHQMTRSADVPNGFTSPDDPMTPGSPASAGVAIAGVVARSPDSSWFPNFVDYLFIAFNTSTAFSPTDTPPLTRWAKGLMMVQSMISLLIVALLAARAVNIL